MSWMAISMAMYLNHSCAPNCETEEDEDERVWIRAIRDIERARNWCTTTSSMTARVSALHLRREQVPRDDVFAKGIEKT